MPKNAQLLLIALLLLLTGVSVSDAQQQDAQFIYVKVDYTAEKYFLILADAVSGEETVLLESHQFIDTPQWSPDKTLIVFGIGSDIYLFDMISQDTVRLTDEPNSLEFDFNWVGGSRQFVYVEREIIDRQLVNEADIMLFDLSTGQSTSLIDDGKINTLPAWSPNGRYMIYFENYLAQGGDFIPHFYDAQTQTTTVLDDPALAGLSFVSVIWSPDSTRFAFTNNNELYIFDMTTRQITLIASKLEIIPYDWLSNDIFFYGTVFDGFYTVQSDGTNERPISVNLPDTSSSDISFSATFSLPTATPTPTPMPSATPTPP